MKFPAKEVYNEYTEIDGQQFAVIHNVDGMKPFFMSIVSSTDLWLFVSSNGGVSAGRVNADNAIFPYDTDDKIIDNHEITGTKTIIRVDNEVWEPWSDRYEGVFNISRNLYKSIYGSTVIFEEINYDLDLQFRCQWSISGKYGLVKTSSLLNAAKTSFELEVLDGVQNVLPPNVNKLMQLTKSNLVNAYKRNELVPNVPLGLITLSANIVDRAEPSEALKASTIWSSGLSPEKILLSSNQVSSFRRGKTIESESDVKGERGAYFISSKITIDSRESTTWYTVMDVNQDQSEVIELIDSLNDPHSLIPSIQEDVKQNEIALKRIVGASDGLQNSTDTNSKVRHFANTTFNVMRGGIFTDNYNIDSSDFVDFVRSWNLVVYNKFEILLNKLAPQIDFMALKELCDQTEDPDLIRLCLEYMPLTFSRRHGDPSRPWNVYNIKLNNPDGSRRINYEGNWRDIFQNWETLGYSYPMFLENMITKFVNASTVDGYNPYRIDKTGVDWELEDPEDPWAFIGYWGDHQVIYLLKLLEAFEQHFPGKLSVLLKEDHYTFANVPYRIKSYQEILSNPYDTIQFDYVEQKKILARIDQVGYDGKFVMENNQVKKVSLIEKLLVMLLAKLSNYIPDGGIWLNTQRPEWNDANNALVGYGVSMVTLYYIRRFISFIRPLIGDYENFKLTSELSDLFDSVATIFEGHISDTKTGFTPSCRKNMVDKLGVAGEAYRNAVYNGYTGELKSIQTKDISKFLDNVLVHIEASIHNNKRPDGLYHAYNLLNISPDGIEIGYLYEMLEGQVSVLSAGFLSSEEVVSLLDNMKSSGLFREDQYSYMLYPNRDLNKFLDKNIVSPQKVAGSELLQKMAVSRDYRILKQDKAGNYHFNADFTNRNDLLVALDQLSDMASYGNLVGQDKEYILELFEEVFNHREFTGRSGTFFGYEGLGSIYWHMVSKLLLAVQENLIAAKNQNVNDDVIGRLVDHYYEIRAGIGINKSAELYGAFPTDPYSHTPWHKGAQQPGMTGQVKEDILSRWGELGMHVENGEILLNPFFLSADEFLKGVSEFKYFDFSGDYQCIELSSGTIGFTYCQVPFILKASEKEEIRISLDHSEPIVLPGLKISEKYASKIFSRSGEIKLIETFFMKKQ